MRGYGSGTFEVKTAWDGEVLGTVQIVNSNVWEKYEIQHRSRMVSRQSILHIEDTEILTYCHSHLSRKITDKSGSTVIHLGLEEFEILLF